MFSLKKSTTFIILIFAITFLSIAWVNQWAIRTFFDLGMVTQALYQIAHGQVPTFTLGIDGVNMPFLATHFSPIIYFYLPFYWLFGGYAPTLLQIIAVLLAGIPIFNYAKLTFEGDTKKANLVLIHFYLIWGIYSALAFDFHNNVIGAMLVPWIFLFLKRKQLVGVLIFSLLLMSTMETFGIWLFFILSTYTFWQYKQGEKLDIKLFVLAIFGLVCSLVIIGIVMPSLQGSAQNLQLSRYQHLGDSISAICWNLFKQPLTFLKAFYINFNDESIAYNKLLFWLSLIFSGGFFLYKNPIFILLFIPPLVFKMLSNDNGFYGVYHQYSIEFVPLISLVLIEGIRGCKLKNQNKILGIAITLGAICNFSTLQFSFAEWDYKVNSQFYTSAHYNPEMNVTQIKNDLKLIPEQVTVSASSCLSPYLYQRSFLYSFPIIKDAKYIAIIKSKRSPWPLSYDEHQQKIQELKTSQQYEVLKESEDLLILKTKH